MRRKILLLSTIIFLFCSFILLNKGTSFADENIPTKMFMPASKLEFYELNSPEAIYLSQDGNMVITEYNSSTQTNSLIIYNKEKDEYYDIKLSNLEIDGPISYTAIYDKYVLFLYSSTIYAMNIPTSQIDYDVSSDNSKDVFYKEYTVVAVGNSFSINGNMLIAQQSSGITLYEISIEGEELKFTKSLNDIKNVDILYCFLSKQNDIYYFVKGKGIYCKKTDGITLTICETQEIAAYMTECGDYIYFTTTTALYRVLKQEKSKLEEVIYVTNGNSLGYLKSPRGLATRTIDNEERLLVADKDLNCIQEILPETKDFSSFAITTQSTANYRLTNNASIISLSDKNIYCLDDISMDSQNTNKRIIQIPLSGNNKSYLTIDLSQISDTIDPTSIKFAISDKNTNYLLISYKDNSAYNLKLFTFKEKTGALVLSKTTFNKTNINITDIYYLDGDFYYLKKDANQSWSDQITSIYKLSLPTEDNEITEYSEMLYSQFDGDTQNFTIDVFGNIYCIIQKNLDEFTTKYYLRKNEIEEIEIAEKPLSICVDFKGIVYLLNYSNKIFTYSFDDSTQSTNTILGYANTGDAKYISLNYNTKSAYILCNGCILQTDPQSFNINTLENIKANGLNKETIELNNKFIKLNSKAKLFKVSLNEENILTSGDDLYFKYESITPISNPNTKYIYTIIGDLDNYYLISYSYKLTALVKKNSLGIEVISEENLSENNISITEIEKDKYYIYNQVDLLSKPIFDSSNYKIGTLNINDIVYELKEVTFNNKIFALVSSEINGEAIGYIPKGYLSQEEIKASTTSTQEIKIIDNNANKKAKDALLIIAISLIITMTLLFVFKKLLFGKNAN